MAGKHRADGTGDSQVGKRITPPKDTSAKNTPRAVTNRTGRDWDAMKGF